MTEAATMTASDELAMLEEQVKAGEAPRGARARIRRLRELCDRELLGPLFKLFASYELRDGVLRRAQLRFRRNRSRDLAEAIGDPRWSTIHELDLHGRPIEPLMELFEDSLFAGREPWRMYEVLEVARRRGAEIVIVPRNSEGPESGWN